MSGINRSNLTPPNPLRKKSLPPQSYQMMNERLTELLICKGSTLDMGDVQL